MPQKSIDSSMPQGEAGNKRPADDKDVKDGHK